MAWLSATYTIDSTPDLIEQRAAALALEQSIECPPEAVTDRRILEEIVARVAAIRPLEAGRYRVDVQLAAETIGAEPAQFLNTIFGNCSLWDNVQLMDVAIPESALKLFPGPRHGIAGVRALLDAPRRAMTCSALKPQGLPVAELVRIFTAFGLGGVDMIKDDHGIADQGYSPFAERVPALARAAQEVQQRTGRPVIYAPNLTGTPRRLRERAELAWNAGIRAVLIEPMVIGLPAFYDLIDEFPGFVYLAHPSFGGATRIAPRFLFGRLLRLFGADAVIFVNYGGRFAYAPEECAAIAAGLRAPWEHVAAALPIPAGGMQVERVSELLDFYGLDSMMLIGGNLLIAREKLEERTREYVQRVTGAAVRSAAERPGAATNPVA
jgi:ribulose-bisphosphate carboxylase large chain